MTAEESALVAKELHELVDKFLPQLLEVEVHRLPALYQGMAELVLKTIEASAIPAADGAIDKLAGV